MRQLSCSGHRSRVAALCGHGTLGLLLIVVVTMTLPSTARAQRPEPEIVGYLDGAAMYDVLPPDAIPAIHDPEFVYGEEAAAQMLPDEPVLGIVVAADARAYSLWHLEAHEIVNDRIAGSDVAVTW